MAPDMLTGKVIDMVLTDNSNPDKLQLHKSLSRMENQLGKSHKFRNHFDTGLSYMITDIRPHMLADMQVGMAFDTR